MLPFLLLGALGLLLLCASLLWRIWTTDALRSIGMFFPVVTLVLVARVWKGLNWESRGAWWGMLPLLYAVVVARGGGNALQAVAYTHRNAYNILPLGLTVFAFASGVVLLLGGTRVWRACLFPLALLLLVNPVPKIFEVIDLPLQYFCASVARSFAYAIGVHPDVNQLRLMFAPGFGMFIAPGCDGIRGAITMAYLALILSYLYRFSIRARILSVIGAFALGYVFNLIRLCFLVMFYRVALSFPSLQPHGEGADYLIGGLLFLAAAAAFGNVIRWKKRSAAAVEKVAPVATIPAPSRYALAKGVALSALVALSCFSSVPDLVAMARGKTENAGAALAAGVFPEAMGRYKLLRTWSEQDWLNHLAYSWGAYSTGEGTEIDMAVWLGPGVHYPVACHVSKGQRPAWQRLTTLPTSQGGSATVDLYFYDEPEGQTLEATTVCDASGCNEHALPPMGKAGFAFVGMGLKDLFLQPASRPLPVLIRAHAGPPDPSSPSASAGMMAQMQDFISQINTTALVRFASSRN